MHAVAGVFLHPPRRERHTKFILRRWNIFIGILYEQVFVNYLENIHTSQRCFMKLELIMSHGKVLNMKSQLQEARDALKKCQLNHSSD